MVLSLIRLLSQTTDHDFDWQPWTLAVSTTLAALITGWFGFKSARKNSKPAQDAAISEGFHTLVTDLRTQVDDLTNQLENLRDEKRNKINELRQEIENNVNDLSSDLLKQREFLWKENQDLWKTLREDLEACRMMRQELEVQIHKNEVLIAELNTKIVYIQGELLAWETGQKVPQGFKLVRDQQ